MAHFMVHGGEFCFIKNPHEKIFLFLYPSLPPPFPSSFFFCFFTFLPSSPSFSS